jgi:hypothetical protein
VSSNIRDPTSAKMREEVVAGSFVVKRSHWIKVEMAVVKAKKAITKEACDVKKLAKQATMVELGSAKKLSRTLKGEREETFRPLDPKKQGGRGINGKGVFQGGSFQGQHPSGGMTWIHLQPFRIE